MKVICYTSPYATHEFEEETKTLYTKWFVQTHDMTEKEFKHEMETWLKVSQDYQPTFIFDYCVDFLYPISIQNQLWMAHLLNPGWIDAGVQKYAHIVPEEFITNLSVDQMFEEFYEMKLDNQFEIRHFSDSNEGLKWLGLS